MAPRSRSIVSRSKESCCNQSSVVCVSMGAWLFSLDHDMDAHRKRQTEPIVTATRLERKSGEATVNGGAAATLSSRLAV